MDFVTVRDFRTYPKRTWEKLEEENRLVITNNGKPFAILLHVDGATLEDTLASIDQAEATRLINKLQFKSVNNGLNKMTMDEIDEEIQKARMGEE